MSAAGDDVPDEESLGTSIERQLARFEDVKNEFGDITCSLARLRPQYDLLKRQCQSLDFDRTSRQTEVEKLNAEIARLTADRDTLEIEFNDARAQNIWWAQYDRTDSASASASATSSFTGYTDEKGKLNRKVWLLEERNKQLNDEMEKLRSAHADELEAEYATAAGLRDRIGTLEMRTKRQKEERDAAGVREDRLKKEVEDLVELKTADEQRWATDMVDIKNSMEKERRETEKLTKQVEQMIAEREVLKEEARLAKMSAVQAVHSPPRALQPLSPNVARTALSPIPITPSKSKVKVFTTLFDSPSKHEPSSPTISLAMKHAYLEDRHKTLKGEYDKLRERYANDIKHLKEWKAVERARNEVKKRKKDEKRARKETSRSASASGTTFRPKDDEGDLDAILIEESESLRANQATPNEHKGRTSDTIAEDEEEYLAHAEVDAVDEVDTSYPVPKPFHEVARRLAETSFGGSQTTTRRIPRHVSPLRASQATTTSELRNAPLTSTGQQGVPEKKSVISASKVTPWLGGASPEKRPAISSARKLQSTRSHSRVLEDEEDDLHSPPGADSFTPTSTNARTPLVRDRGLIAAESARPSSLRRKALNNNLATPGLDSVAHSRASQNVYETPTRLQSQAASTSKTKRKLTDMEGLTPAEKSAQLKRLSKLSASEKRELYKDYKGKGRYLPPEEVRTVVMDEYEIDPDHNEGATYAFHDVKRKKAERRVMHGGDCECCKDYYEAVGDIPRFNQAPAWRDPSPTEAEGSETPVNAREESVRAHQNKVSRHRETWTKPPTPPGYWQIGFPNTQDVARQNEKADQMIADKEARVRKEALQRASKWRKKQ